MPKSPTAENNIRILLADDHHVVRAGLKSLIDAQADMTVIAEVADGHAAWQGAAELVPDVVVMDVSMPQMSGATATRRIRADQPGVRVLALTLHEDPSYAHQLLQAGASGYLLKRAAADELILAIRAVARGGTYIDSSLAGEVVGNLVGRPQPAEPSSLALGQREERVLHQIARGFTNREIAEQLDVSVKTVETHKARAMEKLGLRSRADIVGHAIRHGWLTET